MSSLDSTIAAHTRQWEPYRQVLNETFFTHLPYESAATGLRLYHSRVVLGLFQTRDYALALNQETRPDDPPQELIDARLAARMARQAVLTRARAHLILDGAVLWLGRDKLFSESQLNKQLRRLRELARQPDINVEYIPVRQGLIPSMLLAPFNLVDLPGGQQVVYQEMSTSVFSTDTELAKVHNEAFQALAEIAVDITKFSYLPYKR